MALRGPNLCRVAWSTFLPGPVANLETTINQVIARQLLKGQENLLVEESESST